MEMCNKLITVCEDNLHIVGYPIYIENAKYNRKIKQFNLALIVDTDTYANFGFSLQQMINKAGKLIHALEVFI